MEPWTIGMVFLLGCFVGAGLAGLGMFRRLGQGREALQAALHEAASAKAKLEAREALGAEQEAARAQMREAFEALAARALATQGEAFLRQGERMFQAQQAQHTELIEGRRAAVDGVVQPLREQLTKVDEHVRALETARAAAYDGLLARISGLLEEQHSLAAHTAKLAQALSSGSARGRWGEMQLRRIVELAGMLQHCDFDLQQHLRSDDGLLRPDLVVHLPQQRHIAVDAKVPLDAYLEALATPDPNARAAAMLRHAKAVREHVRALSSRKYAEALGGVDLVVLYLAGEGMFSAALEADPLLLEAAANERVLLCSPTALLAVLRAAALAWRDATVAEHAQQTAELGAELYRRLQKLLEHWSKVGENLKRAGSAYNEATGSLERRVLVTARRLGEREGRPPEDLSSPPLVDG